MADNKRFEVVHKESSAMTSTQILVDKLTGVNYLWHADGYGGGLTVLLDKDGKPVVTPYQIK
ncbi:MAG: DUF6440 family protein [Oscillospiraceae bacterium]